MLVNKNEKGFNNGNDEIMTSRDVMKYLQISENTLLRLESDLQVVPDFRIGNRKRYYKTSLDRQISKFDN